MRVVALHTVELNRLVAVLDNRAQRSASFHRKERVEKSPSAVQPPYNAPKRTLKRIQERESSTHLAPAPCVPMHTTTEMSSVEDFSESD